MLFNKNKSAFDKINDYLMKKGHELVMSIYLSNYNGNNIYIRFDFIKKMSVYKIVWFDLNYFDEKHLEDYVSMQLVTKYLSVKLVEKMMEVNKESTYSFNDKIMGDRVEILTYFKNQSREYIFDRFLPLELDFFIDPLAIIFSYLPRSMEVFLNEIFAKFDGLEEKYNYLKPVKFDFLNSDCKELFKKAVIDSGEKLFEQGKVKLLEKVDDRYLALVEDRIPYIVLLQKVKDDYGLMLCNCKVSTYCKHTYAALRTLREEKFNSFYKVKYIGKEESMLDKVTISNFYLSFGVEGDKIFLVTIDGVIYPADIIQNGKIAFEVIEDDDECTLSKQLEELKKN